MSISSTLSNQKEFLENNSALHAAALKAEAMAGEWATLVSQVLNGEMVHSEQSYARVSTCLSACVRAFFDCITCYDDMTRFYDRQPSGSDPKFSQQCKDISIEYPDDEERLIKMMESVKMGKTSTEGMNDSDKVLIEMMERIGLATISRDEVGSGDVDQIQKMKDLGQQIRIEDWESLRSDTRSIDKVWNLKKHDALELPESWKKMDPYAKKP